MKNKICFFLKRASSAQHLPAYKIFLNVQIAKKKKMFLLKTATVGKKTTKLTVIKVIKIAY